jgi:hypothetical protein
MNKAEYRKKQEDADRKREEAAEDTYRQQVIVALQVMAEQNKAADYQSSRADRFHRQVEKLTLKLEKRRYRLDRRNPRPLVCCFRRLARYLYFQS